MSERDMHFAGFATLLMDELDPKDYLWPEIRQRYEQGIARRAYDLVWHTLHELGIDEDLPFNDATTPEEIPDLTAWPDSETARE